MSEPLRARPTVAAWLPRAHLNSSSPHRRLPALGGNSGGRAGGNRSVRLCFVRSPPRHASHSDPVLLQLAGSPVQPAAPGPRLLRRPPDRDDTHEACRTASTLGSTSRPRTAQLSTPASQARSSWNRFAPRSSPSPQLDGRTEFEYWHIVPAISHGAPAVTGRTLLGYVAKGWGHVHFSDVRDGTYVNPLRPGALGPYAHSTPPAVKSLRVERHDHGVSRTALRGRVDLVAEAFDVTPLAVPKPWANRPVMPALVRWRVVDPAGSSVVPWQTATDFRLRIPRSGDYGRIYARWTRQNRPWSNGRYRLVLARSWDTTKLDHGAYEIEVRVADTQGNASSQRFPVRIAS